MIPAQAVIAGVTGARHAQAEADARRERDRQAALADASTPLGIYSYYVLAGASPAGWAFVAELLDKDAASPGLTDGQRQQRRDRAEDARQRAARAG